ncbi:MAG: SDR family oxidoreductase [Flavipsychrobacter sp.]|nr:SDR family oxidoreductase [Flavipsychrobacter sp.]
MKRFLIAGASSGIGFALAKKLISHSYEVVSISRTKPDLPIDQHIHFDITGPDLPIAIEGHLNGIVYCPGSINLKPFKSLKPKDFQNDLEINLIGAIKIIQAYLPNLMNTETASILLFSTVAVHTGMPYHSSVATAKGAVEGFSKALAAELAPRIRVNVIAPSLVQTPLSFRLTDNETKITSASERHPLKRIGQPEDIASMAMYLLSDDASWITGQILHIDGGISSLRL